MQAAHTRLASLHWAVLYQVLPPPVHSRHQPVALLLWSLQASHTKAVLLAWGKISQALPLPVLPLQRAITFQVHL